MILNTGGGEITQHQPVIYQDIDGQRTAIAGQYVMLANTPPPSSTEDGNSKDSFRVGFQIAAYDTGKPLVIDPVLVYSTYLGGGFGASGAAIAVDDIGNAYITGDTFSSDFPTTPDGFQTVAKGHDAFVTKLGIEGALSLLYSTYLGGSGDERGLDITVDDAGNAYVTGDTTSEDFPLANPYQETFGGLSDAFVIKLNATGTELLYSTYLGGDSLEESNSISLDSVGNAYVTGHTASANFPTANTAQQTFGGAYDVFVSKLNSVGNELIYSTYLGGSDDDRGAGIAVDDGGNAYVAGQTDSADFPVTPEAFQGFFDDLTGNADAFVSKLNPAGDALIYSTYLGGSDYDSASGLAIDDVGNAYVTGKTYSEDFPIANAFKSIKGPSTDAFVSKLDAAGSALMYSTFLGGNALDEGFDIAVDDADAAYVTGVTFSSDITIVNPVPSESIESGDFDQDVGFIQDATSDAFIVKFSAEGTTLAHASHLGGTGTDFGMGIAVDGGGNIYVTGTTRSPDFPTVDPLRGSFSGGEFNDGFVSKIANPTIE